jgi:KaiC/GvpD/RAD55 family RecA-like ATPase
MSDILAAAVKMRGRGIVPIPLHGKIPQVSGWQKLTLEQVNAEQIQQWNAAGLLQNIGALCGEASNNLLVFDFDGLDGYRAFEAQFPELADTLTVATGSGNGMHVYYRAETLPKSTNQLAVPGGHVEIKANGRQVVAPPSVHPDTGAFYELHKSVSIRPLSEKHIQVILDWIAAHNEPEKTYTPESDLPPPATAHRNYAEAALRNEADLLASVPAGTRNDQLNKAAFALGQLVGAGHLSRDEVYRSLFGAANRNGLLKDDGKRTFDATFDSGLRNGMAQPRRIENGHQPAQRFVGPPAYEPPQVVKADNGVVTIGRTRLVKRTSLFEDLQRRIDDDDYIPPFPPIEFPLKCLQHLGGQARVTKPGKIVSVVGASGSGKTSILETMADAYVENGHPVAIWSAEWEPDEMVERAVQRYGGPDMDALYLHEIAKWKASQGREYDHHDLLTVEQRTKAALAMRHVRAWETQVHYIENSLMTIAELGDVVAHWKTALDPAPVVLIIDYAQLIKANEDEADDSTMYNMIQRFKSLCVYYGLVGIIATQTRKADAEQNINEGEFLGTTVLNVTKNSRGKRGHVRVESDPEHLRILDRRHINQTLAEKQFLLGSQAGRYVNDDAFNLWITVNPEYQKGLLDDADTV